MQIIAKFDPNAATTGEFALSELSNGIGTFILWNESNWTLDITMPNGDTDIAPAWTASIFEPKGPQGQVTWMQDSQLDQVNPPQSKVWVVAYQQSDNIAGTFPVALVRQTSVGNVVTTSGGNVANLINDGNIASTQFIESTVSGDGGGSAVSVTVAGVVAIGTTANKGSITLKGPLSTDGATFTTDGSGNLAATSYNKTGITTTSVAANAGTYNAIDMTPTTNNVGMVFYGRDNTGTPQIAASVTPTALNYEIYALVATGDITSGGTLHNTNTITHTGNNSLAAVTPGTVTRIANATQVALQVPGGSTVLSVVSNAINCSQPVACGQFNLTGSSGNYRLYTNSLSRWSDFSGTGSVTVNHNLGATPSFAWCWCDAAASSQTMGNTQTSTQVTVTAGAWLHWHGCAVRY